MATFYDFAVIGLGAVGANIVAGLSRSGYSVIGIEQNAAVNATAGYAGESRLFRVAYHEGPEYIDALMYSREAWLRMNRTSRTPVFLPTGVVSLGHSDSPQMSRVAEAVDRFRIPHTKLRGDELTSVLPQFRNVDGDVAIIDELAGVLRSERIVQLFLSEATSHGATIADHTRVTDIDETTSAVRISTDQGDVTAGKAIITAGVWSQELAPWLAPIARIDTIPLLWFLTKPGTDFSPSRFPGFIRDKDAHHIYGFPTLDGTTIKVGAVVEREPLSAPHELPHSVPADTQLAMRTVITSLLGGIEPEPLRSSIHMDAFTPDRRPIIDAIGDRTVIATGFSGHGFKLTPAWAQIAMDITLETEPRFDATPYRANRFNTER